MATAAAAAASTSSLILRNPLPSLSIHHRPATLCNPLLLRLSKPKSLSFSPKSLKITQCLTTPLLNKPIPPPHLLSSSTRSLTTLFALSLAASKVLANGIFTLAVQLKDPILQSAGPAFFAAARGVPTRSLHTPFTVVAAGLSKWLDLYSAVLMVRVLLSWFPNIPWDRQPLTAIKDLCDPYLSLFRNIIPPVFDTLDVSPLLAFAILGVLGSILKGSRTAAF